MLASATWHGSARLRPILLCFATLALAACGGEVSDVGTEATDDSFDDLTVKPVILLLQFEPDLAQLEYVQSLRSAFEVHVVREATERADAAAVFHADVERELSELDVPGSDVVLIISGHSVGYVFWGNAGESLQATSMNLNDEGAFRRPRICRDQLPGL